MKTSRLLPFVLTALLAGAGGFFLGRGNGPAPASSEKPPPVTRALPPPPPVPRSATVPAILSSAVMELVGTEKITAANAGSITYRILSEGEPGRRMTACMVLLESMTPQNAKGIVDAFAEITKKTGRKHDGEWALMLKRYGAVCGVDGVKQLLPDANTVGLALEGLAAADPGAAELALTDPALANPSLKNYWLNGLCVKDPQRALMLAFNGQYNSADGQKLLTQAINSLGVDEAKKLMVEALAKAPDDFGKEHVFDGAFGQLNEALFHKNWVLGTPGDMLPWLLEQKDATYVKAWMVGRAVKDNFLAGDPVKAIDFLEQINVGRPAIRGTHEIYAILQEKPEAVANLSATDCERLRKFLHADPPSYAGLVKAVEKINPERAKQLRENEP